MVKIVIQNPMLARVGYSTKIVSRTRLTSISRKIEKFLLKEMGIVCQPMVLE